VPSRLCCRHGDAAIPLRRLVRCATERGAAFVERGDRLGQGGAGAFRGARLDLAEVEMQ
jgi:hypothetical protein